MLVLLSSEFDELWWEYLDMIQEKGNMKQISSE